MGSPPPGHDVYVASDLHVSEGWSPATQRFSRLESFFYDNDFRNWVRAISDRQRARNHPATLVLNGDALDFLSIVRIPSQEELAAAGISVNSGELEFGLGNTEQKSVWKLNVILGGHPKFFVALAEHLAEGHWLVINRGNHDSELFWPAVRARLVDALVEIADEHDLLEAPEEIRDRISFNNWFYYEEGRFFLEHGNQYEPSNCYKYMLNPVLPPEYHPDREVMLDYPMGSLFMRYLYNKMKLLDPFTTHYVTLEQYLRITTHHNFVDLLRTGTLHFPFFFRAIREARVFEEQGMAPVKQAHDSRMAELAESSGLGDKIYELEQIMSRPVGTTKYNLLKEVLRPVARGAFTFGIIAILSVLCWFWIFSAIQHAPFLAEGLLAKASMLAILAVLTVVGLFLGFSFVNRALHRAGDPLARDMYEAAERIARVIGVPNVSMGHSHMADRRSLSTMSGTYCNSGTWIPHPGPWDSIRPKARQFTFVTIRGDVMKLHRWNDSAGKWEPVTLLDEYVPSALERLLSESEPHADHSSAEDG